MVTKMQDTKGDFWCENNIIYTRPIETEPDPRGIGWVYFERMVKNGESLAQIDGVTGEEDTFASLLQRCVRTSMALSEMGVEYGDIISVCSYNHLNSCVPHLSAFFIGAKMAALHPSFSHRETVHLFRQVMPKVIFTVVEAAEMIEGVVREVEADTKIVVFGSTNAHIPFRDLIQPKPNEANFIPVEAPNIHDVAIIFFSSGTTGLAKGVCHTHYSILKSIENFSLKGCPGKLMFVLDSPYWNIFVGGLHISILNNWTRLVHPCLDEKDPWSIFKMKIDIIVMEITRMLTLCQISKPNEVNFSSLRYIFTGGSPISKYHTEMIRKRFPGVFVLPIYGQTEVFSLVTCFDPTDQKHLRMACEKMNSCGLLKKGICCKVVDLDTQKALGPNEKGEILVKTEMQLCGYYNVDSSDIWDKDGWLKTGDYGYYDEDYCFYIVDRIKEMFKYRYKHITPGYVEQILYTHPAVSKAVVIGILHPHDNYHAMAVIVLKSGSVDVTGEEIERYVEERVEDAYRLRGGVKFVRSYPLTPSGKIRRFKLKEMMLSNEI